MRPLGLPSACLPRPLAGVVCWMCCTCWLFWLFCWWFCWIWCWSCICWFWIIQKNEEKKNMRLVMHQKNNKMKAEKNVNNFIQPKYHKMLSSNSYVKRKFWLYKTRICYDLENIVSDIFIEPIVNIVVLDSICLHTKHSKSTWCFHGSVNVQ